MLRLTVIPMTLTAAALCPLLLPLLFGERFADAQHYPEYSRSGFWLAFREYHADICEFLEAKQIPY